VKKKILLILVTVLAGLVLANLVVLDVAWLKAKRVQEASIPTPSPSVSSPSEIDICGPLCQQTIEQKISQAISTISGTQKVVETKVVEKTAQPASGRTQPQVIYIPLGGGGSTTNLTWTDVGNAEVWLNIDDYPNLDRAYFEGFIKVKHGNGKAFARLYDVTHSIGVQGGEISTANENFTLVESGSLSFWKGKNLYRIQIKSLNGYDASIDSGRIKIILK